MQTQTVEVSLDNDDSALLLGCLPGQVECIKDIRFRIKRGLGRIQVVGLDVSQSSSPKSNRFSPIIPDWKHQPPTEALINLATIVLEKEPRCDWVFGPQFSKQPRSGGVTQ